MLNFVENLNHFSRGLSFRALKFRGLSFRELETSDPLKNDQHQMSWDKRA